MRRITEANNWSVAVTRNSIKYHRIQENVLESVSDNFTVFYKYL